MRTAETSSSSGDGGPPLPLVPDPNLGPPTSSPDSKARSVQRQDIVTPTPHEPADRPPHTTPPRPPHPHTPTPPHPHTSTIRTKM
ncbi:hypothetical protein GCM10009601_63190 [Streptomyces thermospinosisporus]|uniref:Uncharacterized protein n=1 Tax=Streptomyces thermospinosisporus TaxID=161482 RepID=A0ABP4K1F3_9ACTN